MKKLLLLAFTLAIIVFCNKAFASVVISEIAWMGTKASSNDEWIELANISNEDINLDGWLLEAEDGTPSIKLSGFIVANGFFLLERTNDSTTSVVADLIYTGALSNTGEVLILKDANGNEIERTPTGGWVAGDNDAKSSMERTDLQAPSEDCDNWHSATSDNIATDEDGNKIIGTPKSANSDPNQEIDNPDDDEQSNCETTYEVKIIKINATPASGESEFFTIQNNQETAVDISLWQFSELTSSGTEKFWNFANYFQENDSRTIEPSQNFSLYFSNKLNNDGDTLRIYDEKKCLIDTYIFSPSSSSSTSSKSKEEKIKKLVATGAIVDSVKVQPDVKIQILEVSFNDSNHDYVKAQFICPNCIPGQNLGGIRLATDNSDYEIPPTVFAKSNDFLLFHYSGEKELVEAKKIENTWHFYLKKSGLVATDETLFLLDSNENVFDALCWANQDGKWSTGEEEDVRNLIENNSIKGDLENFDENICFNSNLIDRNYLLIRNNIDTNSSSDFFPSKKQVSEQPKNAQEVEIKMDEMIFYPDNSALIKFSSNLSIEDLSSFSIYLNGNKTNDFDDFNLYLEKIDKMGGIIQIKDIWENNAFSFTWNGGIESFRFPADLSGSIKRISDGNSRINYRFAVATTKSAENKSSLEISEIFPNPEGKDSENEFIELYANEDINLKDWKLFVNNKKITLPDKQIDKDTFFKLNSQEHKFTLTNTGGKIILVSPNNENITLNWDKAIEGNSFAKFDNQYLWTSFATPEDKNIFVENKKTTKKSKSNIKDFSYFSNSSEYLQYLSENLEINFEIQARKIVFSGKTAPNAQIKGFISSDNVKTFSAKANKSGIWKYEFISNLSAGKHNLDLNIVTPENIRLLKNNALAFEIKKALRDDEIFNLEIISVLPNPKGADKNNEKVVIKNTSKNSGWIRDWKLKIDNKTFTIPNYYLQENQLLEITNTPSLRNTGGSLILLNFDGKEIDKIAWGKSKDNEIWTKNGKISPKSAIKKTKTKKTNAKEENQILTTKITGKIIDFSAPYLTIFSEDGIIREFEFENNKNSSFFIREMILQKNTEIEIEIDDNNKIISFDILKKPIRSALDTNIAINSWLFIASILLILLANLSFFSFYQPLQK